MLKSCWRKFPPAWSGINICTRVRCILLTFLQYPGDAWIATYFNKVASILPKNNYMLFYRLINHTKFAAEKNCFRAVVISLHRFRRDYQKCEKAAHMDLQMRFKCFSRISTTKRSINIVQTFLNECIRCSLSTNRIITASHDAWYALYLFLSYN